jgi:aminoglycoside/choline kinase family phosphotransferase
MSIERTPTEVAAFVATDAAVRDVAAHALRLPAESLTVTRLAGDASSRSFYRVTHPDGTVVAVRYPWPFSVDDGSNVRFDRWCEDSAGEGRLTFANDPLCHLELTALFDRAGVPVPAVVAVADRDGIIFVEDAGDDLVQTWSRTVPPADAETAYERAVDLIAAIRSATEDAISGGNVAGRLAFDADKLAWELEFWRANCFERFLGAPLEGALDAEVRRESRELAEALGVRPRVLCHRDYHARNLIVRTGQAPREGLVVIDFQDARLGPLTYDVVSLLEDPYAELDAELRARLLERFVDGTVADGTWPGADVFREEYDLMTLQRLLKAIGTYTNQAAVRGKREYLPYIAPAASEARAALVRLGRYPALGRAIDIIEATE